MTKLGQRSRVALNDQAGAEGRDDLYARWLAGGPSEGGRHMAFLHGFTGDTTTWDRLAPFLSDRTAPLGALAVDLPGHGASPDAPTYSIPGAALAAESRVAREAPLPWLWLGYSMGARLALWLAVNRPAAVRGVILVSGTAGISEDSARAERRASDEALARGIETGGLAAFVDRWMGNPLFASQTRLGTDYLEAARRQRLRNRPAALAAVLRGMGTGAMEPMWGLLERVAMPVLVVVGDEDHKYLAIGERLCRGLPDCRMEIVAGSGHAVHVEAPEKLADLIHAFIDRAAV